MNGNGIPTLYQLSGKMRKEKLYILYPSDSKIHAVNLSLDTEAHQILGIQNVGDPVVTFLKMHYGLLKIKNTGSPLPFYSTMYEIKIHLNLDMVQNEKYSHAMHSIIALMRVIDKAADGASIPYWCKVYDFSEKAERPIQKLHGYGSRSLELELRGVSAVQNRS